MKIPTNKTTLATTIGTLVEWAEFSCYGYLASKFAHLFFAHDQKNALILSFAIFAASYLARPFGAMIFGYIGDNYGRRLSLTISLISMGIATLGIGLTPTYADIGIAAPIILLGFRIIQGLSVSGEFTGAAIFIAEHYQGNRKSLAVSWVSFSSALGMLIGSGLAAIVSIETMPIWAWRLPFYVGFIGCFSGVILRFNTTESPQFLSEKHLRINKHSKNKTAIDHPESMDKISLQNIYIKLLQCFFIAAFVGVYIYICNMWWTSYVVEKNLFSNSSAHFLAVFGVVGVVILTPIAAWISDIYGAKKILLIGLATAVFSVPIIFLLSQSKLYSLGLLAQLIYAITNVLVTGSMFRYLSEAFPVKIRYLSLGMSWSFAVAIFGGTAPMLAQYILTATGNGIFVASYVSLISFLAFMIVKTTT